ncbi:MAG: hypothetical protein ACI37S_00400 [Candidatus Gastranaerophilaceae bacterium]
MGIIGIVAALTIPNLNSSTNNRELVTRVKKIHSQLNEAQARAEAVYGPINTWFLNDNYQKANSRYFNRITEFMKVSKTCVDTYDKGCASPKNRYYFSGSLAGGTFNDCRYYCPQAVLADGASVILVNIRYFECGKVAGAIDAVTKSYCGDVVVDIDGPNKGKNAYGRDLFSFAITGDGGIIPRYTKNTDGLLKNCLYDGHSGSCGWWIIEKGNADYMYVKYDSSSRSVLCPDNQPLTWERGSCK